MATQARNWLPRGSLDDGALATALAGTVEAWSAAWFVRARLAPTAIVSGEALAAPADGQWLDSGAGLALAVPGAAQAELTALLLGATPDGGGPVDADILARLVRDCLDDLARRLAAACGLPAETRWAPRDGARVPELAVPYGIALRGTGVSSPVRLAVAGDLAIALRRNALALPVSLPPPRPAGEALERQRIAVAAALGRCRLTLADVAGLGVGDVLVLDTPTAEPLALAIDDAVVAPGVWRVGEADDRLHLTLLAPVPRMIA